MQFTSITKLLTNPNSKPNLALFKLVPLQTSELFPKPQLWSQWSQDLLT